MKWPYRHAFVDATIRTHPTPPNQIENIPTGTVLPPVPTSLVEINESGAFIEMGDLIPTHLGLDDTACSKLRCFVTNISEWLQAFAVYISVIAKKQPHHVPDLMGYQILILKASNEYRGDCWLGYDWRFQQRTASQSNRKWSDMDSTLWNMAFTGQATTGLLSLSPQPRQRQAICYGAATTYTIALLRQHHLTITSKPVQMTPNMQHRYINIAMITHKNHPLPHTPILNSVCIHNYILY